MANKKGDTLLEVLAGIAIITVVIASSLKAIKDLQNVQRDISLKRNIVSVVDNELNLFTASPAGYADIYQEEDTARITLEENVYRINFNPDFSKEYTDMHKTSKNYLKLSLTSTLRDNITVYTLKVKVYRNNQEYSLLNLDNIERTILVRTS